MWKFIFGSVAGTSHRARGEDCQDNHSALVTRVGEEDVLIAACADGAGSASHGAVGAKLACERIVSVINAELEGGLAVAKIDRERMLDWYTQVRSALDEKARSLDLALGDVATTLLVSIVGARASAFAQLGDGAIVAAVVHDYEPVFWPKAGEYANITTFLTSDTFATEIEFKSTDAPDEFAMFTDGLQRLALDFSLQRAHTPFFSSLFTALRLAEAYEDLFAPLRSFLDSDPVNTRTDDDKTLILATRRVGAVAS